MKARRRLACVFLMVSCLSGARAAGASPAPRPSVRLRALAILMQVEAGLEESVASGELGQVHGDDEYLYAALVALSLEGKGERLRGLDTLIAAVGQSVSDVHAAADAFDKEAARSHLEPAQKAFAQILAAFGADDIASARALAAQFTCPMHPDVSGDRDGACPKCGMPLVTRRRVILGPAPDPSHRKTIDARICTEEPLAVGSPANGVLTLRNALDEPVLLTDLREAHTQKIHLLIVDPTLSDYHHEHPVPTGVPGEYAFHFTPRVPGPYRAFADLQPLRTGFQEYAAAEIPAATMPHGSVTKTRAMSGEAGGLRYELAIEAAEVKVGVPVSARVRVTKDGRPFVALEPLMAAFAHLVAFHEAGKIVLHMHPIESRALKPEDRGGPDLAFRFFADVPGYYRLFLQTQVDAATQLVSFGIDVQP